MNMKSRFEEQEAIFNGTPAQFVHAATTLMYHLGETDEPPEFLPNRKDLPDAHLTEIIFFGPGMRQQGIGGRITAETRPDGKSRLLVRVDYREWSKLERYWLLLRAELVQQGWIDAPTDAQATPSEPIANHVAAQVQPELQTIQIQSPSPIDAPKKANWTRDQKLALIGIIIAAIALIVTIAVALFQLGVIQDFMYAATPALTPVIVSPAATP